jgi:DNA-binding PadR family transcriptional regulator
MAAMLDLAILGLLEERGELHGYEIRKQLRSGLGILANVSFGSLYPALARLEAAGAVEAVDATLAGPEGAQQPVPPTGSLTGEWAVLRAGRPATLRSRGRRSRKVYRITSAGRGTFADLLAGSSVAEDQRSFGLRVAFARHLPAPARLALLERRRLVLDERLRDVRSAGEDGKLDVYARSVVEHTADGIEHDIRWLERLIDAERTAQPPTRPEGLEWRGKPRAARTKEKQAAATRAAS